MKLLATPESFVRGMVQETIISPQQTELLRIAATAKRLAIKSGHSTGKTRACAWLAWWFHFHFRPSKVITTAPTNRQVKQILWSEIRAVGAHIAANLKMQIAEDILDAHVRQKDPEWFITGFSSDDAQRFQGFHSPNLLVLVDEASGIEPQIWQGIRGILTTENARLIVLGQPLGDKTNEFIKKFFDPTFEKITFSSIDSPFCAKTWIADAAREWGENSALYQARVLGQIPDALDDVLIPLSWMERCLHVEVPIAFDSLGIDVARYGDDLTVLQPVKAGRALPAIVHHGRDLMHTCGAIIAAMKQNGIGAESVYIDDTGLGGGVTDRLRELGYDVNPVNFGAGAKDRTRFYNARSEIFWNLRERVRLMQIRIPEDGFLSRDLADIKHLLHSDGTIKLESKADIKKRLGHSPDRADALALACCTPEMAAAYCGSTGGAITFTRELLADILPEPEIPDSAETTGKRKSPLIEAKSLAQELEDFVPRPKDGTTEGIIE